MVVVLFEESIQNPTSINNQEIAKVAEVARMFGCQAYPFPSHFEEGQTAEDALKSLTHFEKPTVGIWVGFVPTLQRYNEVYKAATQKNLFLVNTPEQHQTIKEFDLYYPMLGELTPRSQIITRVEDCDLLTEEISFPLFVRGAGKSNKEQGWKACVANNKKELKTLVQKVFEYPNRARGKVVLRQLVPLRHRSIMPGDFPQGREYRVFLYKQEIIAFGYYWDEFKDEYPLTDRDIKAIHEISIKAATCVNVPFIMADIGQLESGNWIIIELGDAQFAGLSNVSILELWSKLSHISL